MGVLDNLKPGKVFYYFEELSKIPHGSGNMKEISNYCVDFAKLSLCYISHPSGSMCRTRRVRHGGPDGYGI